MGAALINLNSEIELESISNAFNINKSRIKKEIKNIEKVKNPKSEKSRKFLDLIKK
jgi:predicted transcriptional regulator